MALQHIFYLSQQINRSCVARDENLLKVPLSMEFLRVKKGLFYTLPMIIDELPS